MKLQRRAKWKASILSVNYEPYYSYSIYSYKDQLEIEQKFVQCFRIT